MTRISEILEPGERIVVRDPPAWGKWAVVAFYSSPFVLTFMTLMKRAETDPSELWKVLGIGAAVGALGMLTMIWSLRWRILVTNRRAIGRKGALLNEVEHMRLEEIQEVQQLPMGLLLRGRDREMHVRRFPLWPLSATVLRAVDPAYDGPKMAAEFAAGETVLARNPRPWGVIWHVVAAIGAFGAIFVGMAWEKIIEDPTKAFPLAGILLGTGAFFGGLAWLATASTRDAWAITERRFRVSRGLLRRDVREIAIDEIESASFAGTCLTLRGAGKAMDIRGLQVSAPLLSQVLPTHFPSAGEPFAQLNRLLRPGERLLMRTPGRWADYMNWVTVGTVAVGTAGILAVPPLLFGKPLTLKYLAMALLPLLAFAGTAFENRHGAGWAVAVTDSRLLRRLPYDSTRYEEIETRRIRKIRRRPDDGGLLIRLEDRDVDITIDRKTADRILAALGRTAEDAR